jgi:subtilisin family serine protease
VRKRWPGIFALCILTCLGRAGALSTAAAQDASIPDDYVVVQLAGGVSAQAQVDGDKSPTFEQLGYRTLAVPKGMTAGQFLAELRARPDVISAEPDPKVYAADNVPNDPLYANSSPGQAPYLGQIGAPAAWSLSTGNGKVVVAVIDSGIDVNHPDLASRLWTNPADSFSDGVDHDNNGCVNDIHGCRFVTLTTDNHQVCGYSDDSGTGTKPTGLINDDSGSAFLASHGTFVSGIIGAAGNNNVGISGVAWNVQLMTVKVLDCGTGAGRLPSGLMSDVVKGILYATRMGANVINVSLSSQRQVDDTPDLRNAIQVAQSNGVIVVAAAGNYGSDASQPGPGYPGAYSEFPNLITVGAADQNNGMRWVSTSAYGPALDLAAPGAAGIISTVRTDLTGSTGYVRDNNGGTSFATPMVAGMFALMISRNTHLNAADYIQIARDTATPPAPAPLGQNWAGSGVINIGAAVAKVPMSVNGAPLRDWKDVPAGTEMRASVDGNDCGFTKTIAIGPAGQYDIRVKSALDQPGCGAPGKIVQLSIGGVPALPTLTWGALNEDLGLARKDVSTVSPPPGAVVVQALNGSWSNIAFFEASGNLPSAFGSLPTPWSAAYRWDPAAAAFDGTLGAFQHFIRNAPAIVNDWNSVQTFDTFWVDAPATNIASLNPNPATGRVLQLKPGWNNFVYTGSSKEVEDALSEVAGQYTEVLQYDNAAKAWLIHTPNQPRRYLNDFGGIFKLKVYWIYMTAAGTVTMN